MRPAILRRSRLLKLIQHRAQGQLAVVASLTMLLAGKGNPDFIFATFSKMLVEVVFAMVC